MLSNVGYNYDNPSASGSLIASNNWIQPINGTIAIPEVNPAINMFENIVITNNNNVPDIPLCFAKGTLILTPKGYVKIELLKPDDVIIVKSRKMCQMYQTNIITIIKQSYKNENVCCVEKEAFGPKLPFQNLYLSQRHMMVIPDGKSHMLRHVGCLFEHNFSAHIKKNLVQNIEFYNIKIPSWPNLLIIANGICTESYNDDPNIGWMCNNKKCVCIRNFLQFYEKLK